MYLNRLNVKVVILFVSLLSMPTDLFAWTDGLVEAAKSLYNGTSTTKNRLFIHEHINEINEMALAGDLPDNLYQSAQGDFWDRNYADLKKAAAKDGLDITMKKPEHFQPGTDTDAPLTRPSGSDVDITVEKLKKVEKNYKNNIKQHYEDAGIKTPADIPDTNTDILVDPDATSEFKACADHVNNNGGTAYTDPDAVRAEIKIARDEPISFKEASARNNQTKKLANKKVAEARSLRKEASVLEKTHPKKARKLRVKAQLADSQASKYINRTNQTTNKLRTQNGLKEIPFDSGSSLDKAIRNIDIKGRNHLTKKDSLVVGNMQKQASEKASQKFIDSLAEIAKTRPHTASDVQKAIAKELNTMTPSAQGHAIENLERKVGKTITKNIINEAKALKGIKIRTIPKPLTTPKKFINGLTKPRTLGVRGKKFVALGYKAVNVTMIAGMAYFMGKDGVYHALKNVTADETDFEFFLDVYKEAAWHGSGLGYAFEEAQAEEIAMWEREIERGEPSDSMRKHVTITIGKTIVYWGRDIVVATLTLPDVFLEYLIGYKDAEKKEKYSIAFLAEVRRQIKSKKEFNKAIDVANEDGIAFNDQKMYLDCMCSDCGGSLGGFFRPQFHGGGYGPCQCNGPLSIWKTPISGAPEKRATCKERIKQKNNRITDARMDELHKIAMAANAKSVAKELAEIKQLLNKGKKLDKATELFINIQPLLYPKNTQELRKVIEPKLEEKSQLQIQKGNLKDAIKSLERKNRVAGLPDDRTYNMALAKTWLKSWERAKKTFFPEIRNYLKERKITQAQNKLKILNDWMQPTGENKESLFPPAYKDPDYLALIKMLKDKKQERMTDINSAKSKSNTFVAQQDPKSAVKVFENVLKKWEHTKADNTQLQNELNNHLKVLVHNAQAANKYGDKLVKKGDISGGVESYKKSLAIQKDTAVQRKLDDLLKKEATGEKKKNEEGNKDKMHAGTKENSPSTTIGIAENSSGGYWKLVERKGSIGRECTQKDRYRYSDYYRNTISGFGTHITIANMLRKGDDIYCKHEAEWQQPPEKLYPKTTITIPVTIKRVTYTGKKYGCGDMVVSFDSDDMECGSTSSGIGYGSVRQKVKDPKVLNGEVKWKVKDSFSKKAGEKLTIRTCFSNNLCGKPGLRSYYEWVPDNGNDKSTNKKEKTGTVPHSTKNIIVASDKNVFPGTARDDLADSYNYVIDGDESHAWAKLVFVDPALNGAENKSFILILTISKVADAASRNGLIVYHNGVAVGKVGAVTRGQVVEAPLDMGKIEVTNGRLELILRAAGTDAPYIMSKVSGQGAELKIIFAYKKGR